MSRTAFTGNMEQRTSENIDGRNGKPNNTIISGHERDVQPKNTITFEMVGFPKESPKNAQNLRNDSATTNKQAKYEEEKLMLSEKVDKDYLKNLGFDESLLTFDFNVVLEIIKKQYEILREYAHPDRGNCSSSVEFSLINDSYNFYSSLVENGKFKSNYDLLKYKRDNDTSGVKLSYNAMHNVRGEFLNLRKNYYKLLTVYDTSTVINNRLSESFAIDVNIDLNDLYGIIYDTPKNSKKVYVGRAKKNDKKPYFIINKNSVRYSVDSDVNNGKVVVSKPLKDGVLTSNFHKVDTLNHEIIGFIAADVFLALQENEIINGEGSFAGLSRKDIVKFLPYLRTSLENDEYSPFILLRYTLQDGKENFKIERVYRAEKNGEVLLKSETEILKDDNTVRITNGEKKYIEPYIVEYENPLRTLGFGQNVGKMPLCLFKQFIEQRYKILKDYYQGQIEKNLNQKKSSEIARCKRTLKVIENAYNYIAPFNEEKLAELIRFKKEISLNDTDLVKKYERERVKFHEALEVYRKKVLSFCLPSSNLHAVQNLKNTKLSIHPLMALGRFITDPLTDIHNFNIDSRGYVVNREIENNLITLENKIVVGAISKEIVEDEGGIIEYVASLKCNPEDKGVLLIEGNVEERMNKDDVYGKRIPARYSENLIDNIKNIIDDGDYLVTYNHDIYGGYFAIEGVVSK
ncbi:MAG: hypothetical protein ACOX3T_00695 [Bdellovibrionota bacterium]